MVPTVLEDVAQILKLNCWVFGDRLGSVFTVEISPDAKVSALRELIKQKKKPAFDHIAADALDLWNVCARAAAEPLPTVNNRSTFW